MGGICCKTATVIPLTTTSMREHLLNNVEWIEQQDIVIKKTSLSLPASALKQTAINRESSSKSNQFIKHPLNTKESPPSDSNEVTAFQTTLPRPTSTKTTKSNSHQEIISSALNKRNSHDKIHPRLTSADSKAAVMRRKINRTIVDKSAQSKFFEGNISDVTSNEFDRSHSSYDDILSSSSTTNTEKTILRQNTLMRFTSPKPKNFTTCQGAIFNDTYSDSDESYPIHNSFVTSTPSYPDESSTQQETADHLTLSDTQSIITNESSNQLDKMNPYFERVISSMSSDSEEVVILQEVVVKSKSLNLSKSDTYPKTIAYETSSDPNDG